MKIQSKPSALIIVLLLFLTAIPAQAEECNITMICGSAFTLPVALSEPAEIEALDIEISFDADVLELDEAGVTFAGGILNSEDYTKLVTADGGTLTIVIYSVDNLISGSGDAVFINFRVLEKCSGGTALLFTKFLSNSLEASGGFRVNSGFHQELKINAFRDINGDSKIGTEEAIYALRCVSGLITECVPADIGLEHAVYALRVASGISQTAICKP